MALCSRNEYGQCQFVFSEYIVTGLKLKYLTVYVLFKCDIEIFEDGNALYYYKIYMIGSAKFSVLHFT